MKDEFIELLKITKRKGINNLIHWLENETDFFTAPASTKYHLSKESGLLEHSLNVYDELVSEYGISDNISSLIIVALLHDICKANYYSISERNVNKNGKWIKEPYYTVNDQFPLGHGEKSVILIQRYIDLTDEEIAAIRWHMGAYEPKENYSTLGNVFNKYPLALYLHIADLKATYITEKEV
jgi:hypothetical protein